MASQGPSARLAGRIAIVTGAGRGLGRAIAARFLDEGARVVIAERDEAAGADAVDELSARGEVKLAVTDVAREAQVAAAVETAVAWGGLHIVVNNAAIANPHSGPIELLDESEWNRLLAINLTGPVLVTKHAVPHLRRDGGAIVNLTSTRAFMSEPHSEAYATAKGGIVALTHALAISLGPAIRVNAIAPGWVPTDAWQPRAERKEPDLRDVDDRQHPVGRVGRPEEVGALAAYLASDEAGFITGQTFVIDGGMTRKMIYAE